MKRIIAALALVSVPALMMMQVLQSYRYAAALEEAERFEDVQEDRLEENKRLLAGIAVFSAPERVYKVGTDDLGLDEADPESVMQVRFPDDFEVNP